MTYSDWLAWIMEQLDNAADVFRLFGITAPPHSDQWRTTRAEREKAIPGGCLDIVQRWPGKALLVIEVKKTVEESAVTAKQRLYEKWIGRQKQEPRRDAILLIVDSKEGESHGRFKRCDWRDVCIELRCLASRKEGRRKNVVRSGLMLAFAGAVEQNLLDMPGRPLQLMKSRHLLNVDAVVEYLKVFHGRVKW
jgi:hypothetical protein